MADEKKDSKPKSDSKGDGWKQDLYSFVAFLIILFVFWVITGGPSRSPESRQNQFITTGFQTYHKDVFGKPGSVTDGLPSLR